MSNTIREGQLARIEQAEKRLLAKKQRIQSNMRNDKRKLDTRRKILLGSMILKAASVNPGYQVEVRNMVAQLTSERDRLVFASLFEQWDCQQVISDFVGNPMSKVLAKSQRGIGESGIIGKQGSRTH
ncbi:MAG: hypothetical protein R8K50_09960 [Mariprofundus sp.]